MYKYILSALLLMGMCNVHAQTKSFVTADLLANKLPKNFRNDMPIVMKWLDDDHVILKQKSGADSVAKNYVMDIKSGKLMEASAEQMKGAVPPAKSVAVKNNDLFYKNGAEEKQITFDKAEEKNPIFSPDSTYIAYTKNNDLYTYHILSNKENRLTNDGTSTTLNGFASWVYYEEIFGRQTRYRAFWWNPNSKQLAYMHFDESMVPMFPIYSSDGQHGFLEETRYPKAGDKNPDVKLGFVSADGGATTWADFNDKDDQYFGWPIWREDGSTLLVQWINRGQDHLKIFDVNPASGSKKIMYEEQQKTWVDLEDNAGGRITFLKTKPAFILESDKTGWNHLYLHNNDGTLVNAITSGNFRVLNTLLTDEKNGLVYFTARSKENTARIDLYSVKLNGTDLKRLSFGEYNHSSISLSPNGKYFITTYSNVSTPANMSLLDTKGKLIRELGDAMGTEMNNYGLAKTELIRIKSEDGLFELPAVVTWPANMDPNKKYPMLVSIYGGPNAGTVMDGWNWNPNRQFYAQEGMIQVAFDHRASGHFGKAGVNYMHRNLGYWEMKDYMTMANWFIAKGFADPTKIAITGFSYGGYMSCYALTYGSSVFTHGMAGGSVVDWHLYDSHYTEKFMDTPQENPEGYKTSSVLPFVDQYKGVLQIVHGTMDDNVHMQNSIQLIAALQDKGKDFEFMLYPGGRHGWRNLRERNNHFENLKTKFIYKYLLEKSVPKGALR
ncbi:MAG: DPP IV N-terminal domain-containing protein [Sediminibacterium sp.]|nr:DPP IV N-terminal domain-containing protein [Sediminibacterium sp.]